MKAFIVDRYKPRDRGRIADVPQPVAGTGQVLVQIHAAGVNLLDSKIMSGEFKLILPYRMPLILGHDVAGVVVEVGSGVRRLTVGDEVYARPDTAAIGTFAEFISIGEADVALKPSSISMEEAASLPLVGLTAWQALVERANLQRGQTVFIQAGSGGVGAFAIQLAKHLRVRRQHHGAGRRAHVARRDQLPRTRRRRGVPRVRSGCEGRPEADLWRSAVDAPGRWNACSAVRRALV